MNRDHAFGAPPGSVRAVLALLLVGSLIGLSFLAVLQGADAMSVIAVFGGLTGSAIQAYFGKEKVPPGGPNGI